MRVESRPVGRPRSIWNGRAALVLLLLCFFVPAVVAWTLFFTGWTPSATGNHGELIQPPVRFEPLVIDEQSDRVPDSRFRGRWNLVVDAGSGCGEACADVLDELLRVRVALAQHADRTRIVLLLPPDAEPPTLPETALGRVVSVYWHPDATGTSAPERLPDVQLVDTRGFAMMRYPVPFDASGVFADLKKLLRISNIDLERLQGLAEDV